MTRKTLSILGLLCVAVLLAGASVALAEDDGKAAKKRDKIDARSDEVLEKVVAESPRAEELFQKAIGYAVFANTKAALGVSGGGGSGVAVDKASGARTYMKMGTAGVGFGIGVKKYQVVMLFENEKVFRAFVEKGWQADTQAGAAAGTKGAAAKTTFHDGIAVFVRTNKGLMASADVSGTKYWKSDLND
ncbi:MAG: YSC84-related protein [Acidobacteriota bacterium]|nr:YSC84-related protein [Acidobacteriota bacterium]MDH3784424.1 YSC84-related protein [Acidobacteriota bacterium]